MTACINTHNYVSVDLQLMTCLPVSYTHLDVYKRQNLYREKMKIVVDI